MAAPYSWPGADAEVVAVAAMEVVAAAVAAAMVAAGLEVAATSGLEVVAMAGSSLDVEVAPPSEVAAGSEVAGAAVAGSLALGSMTCGPMIGVGELGEPAARPGEHAACANSHGLTAQSLTK